MPRRLLGVFMLLLVSVLLGRAQGDVMLLTIGDEAVCKSEFEYFFGRSPEKRADVFAETYACFKQKVQYAKELRLDTLSEYRSRMEVYRQALEHQKRRLQGDTLGMEKEWMKLVHITWPLKQSAGKLEQQAGKRYLDSLSIVLSESAIWQEQVEELPWIQTRYLLDEWRHLLKSLERNEFSEPFFSPLGIHVIAWIDKVKGKGRMDDKEIVADENYRLKEMEEGLLVLMLDAYWDETLDCTEQDLEKHFKAHRAEYGGGIPHLRGAVIHCQSKKEAKAIKKYLKNYPEALWEEAFGQMPEEVSTACRVEKGLFAIGKNPYVDKLVFGCGDFQPLSDFPYTWVLGKKLKKGPVDYRDVRVKVEKDCREARKNAEMEALMQKYRVEIDKEVLKTVNRAGNK